MVGFGNRVSGERFYRARSRYISYWSTVPVVIWPRTSSAMARLLRRLHGTSCVSWVCGFSTLGGSGFSCVELADNSGVILSLRFRIEAKTLVDFWMGWSYVLVSFSGAGLLVLRNNNLIHRDLKPQVGPILDFLQS